MAVKYTSKILNECEFSWTIENFSLTPDVLQGPSVSSIPGLAENLHMELCYKANYNVVWECYWHTLTVTLKSLNADPNVFSSNTTLRHSNDAIIRRASTPNLKLAGNIILLEHSEKLEDFTTKPQLSKEMKLIDDKLVVKGKLSFPGCETASSVPTPSVQDDFAACEEVLKDLKSMYETGCSSDITFSVGGKTLRAHKFILVSRSPVFEKMFNTNMSENNSKIVVIEDTDSNSFNHFLMFLYTGIVEDKKSETVLALYSLAHKYQVNSLHSACSRILAKKLSIHSACSVLVLSDLHGDTKLKDAAKVFIRRHLSQVAGTTKWAEIINTKALLVKEVLDPKLP